MLLKEPIVDVFISSDNIYPQTGSCINTLIFNSSIHFWRVCRCNRHKKPCWVNTRPSLRPPSSDVFARCTKSLVSRWLFGIVWWLARSWALVTDCEAYVFTPSMLAGSWGSILIDWASSQQPSPLCLTRSGWGGFAYSLDETSMKMKGRPPLIQAWHWPPGQQAFCAALQNGCICYEASDKQLCY